MRFFGGNDRRVSDRASRAVSLVVENGGARDVPGESRTYHGTDRGCGVRTVPAG